MELQQARIRGVAHCIIPQEFTIKKPIIPLPPPLQQLMPVVVGQSPGVQMSGAPAVVQVLVPPSQIIPNPIPVLVPSNAQQTTTTTVIPPVQVVGTGTAVNSPQEVPPVPVVEAKSVSSYILESTTMTNKLPESTTTAATIIMEEATEQLEIAPEEIPPVVETDPVNENDPELNAPDDNASRMRYSADPPTEDELLSSGILAVSVPEVIMPPIAESSNRKLVMPPDEDPPLHDQEMPPAPTISGDDV